MYNLVLTLLLLVAACSVQAATDRRRRTSGCRGLVRYNVTFVGLWSRVDFPKQYPLFRPHAQWTKIVGRTHNTRYNLFSPDKLASPAVKEFSELGTTGLLDKDSQGVNGVFDTFALPSLGKVAEGATSGRVIVDGKHAKMSLIARVVPSPDWFVGVDSLDLCRRSAWVERDEVELYPYDAGTDMGYTFTAPNWPETPPKPIVQITSQKPSHPANSFYYPDLPELPPLARLEIRRVGSYSVKEILEQDVQNASVPEEEDSGDAIDSAQTPTPQPTPAPRRRPAKTRTSSRRWWRQRHQANQNRLAGIKDCEVGEWSEWGACSKSCGFGKRMRMRRVTQRPTGNGSPCPPLLEDELCGSMRNCNWNHFSRFDNLRRQT